MFRGQTVLLVAGGPSLAGFDWSRLAGRNVCAINRAYEVLPDAQMLYWSDAIFWRSRMPQDGPPRSEAIMAHRATLKATLDLGYQPGELPEGVVRYRRSEMNKGVWGFDPDPKRICHCNNSAGAAMHVLAHLGVARIILLGVDMKHANGKTHWHDGHGRYIAEEVLRDQMLPHFAALKEPLAERGIEVLNANPDSALDVWPKVMVEEALAL